MPEGVHSSRVIRFGIFEVDLQSGELRKAGLKLKLTGQPFQVLAILLEHPGEVVTREELQKRLWPDTFVDIDHNLNTAINKIREVLGDSAESPRFVETLPRRGYRFIAPINHENASASVEVDSERWGKDGAAGKTAAVNAVGPAVSHKFRWLGVLAAVIVILAIAGMFVWLRLPQAPPRVLATTQVTKDGVPKGGVLTDGSRLYIEEFKGAQFLVQAAVTGGETSLIPTPFASVHLMDISPDRSQLLVADLVGIKPQQFWALPLPSGPLSRIADVTGAAGKWSPDGRQLLFANGENVYLAKAHGTDVRKLFTLPSDSPSPVSLSTPPQFSPDATRIRFDVFENTMLSSSIWEIRTDGTNLHPLLTGWRNPPTECCGVWSPDGRYYFFLSYTPLGVGGNIWAIRESKGFFRKCCAAPVQLTTGPTLFGLMTPSPDGKKLYVDGFQARGELIRYDAQHRGFVPFLSGISAGDVSFSRDAQWIAYVSYPERILWRSRADGSERLQLTSAPVFAALPRWSPDGTQIEFLDMQAGRPWKILLISAQGGAAQEMFAENLPQVDAGWSPDGQQMVFGHGWWDNKQTIQLLNVNSKQVSIVPGSEGLYSPRWSPDGRYIVALTDDARKIVIFDFKTQKWSDWVSGPGTRSFPAWSRNGRYLYFESHATDTPGYYRIQLGQTRPELVVDFKDLHQFPNPITGFWSGITPDGSPLFVRDLSTDEIYALDLELP
jgi:DNA-binding winged helix-turn-helix (wHTH) protein/Tol biopolymer transport system component